MTRGSVWWVQFDPAVGDDDIVSIEAAIKRFFDLK